MKNEAKLGILAIVIIGLFTWMMIVLSDFQFKKETYEVPVIFPYVGGLDVKSSVRLAGVKVGEVKSVDLKDGVPFVVMEIDYETQIKEDAKITINTLGFIGSNYIEIGVGSADAEYYGRDFDEPLKGEAPLNVGDIMMLINDASKKFNEIGNSITQLSDEIQEVLEQNKQHLSTTMENLAEISASTKELVTKLDTLSNELNKTAKNLNSFYDENSDTLNSTFSDINTLVNELQATSESLHRISRKIEEGEGTLGKFVNDDQLYNDVNDLVQKSNKLVSKVNTIRFYWEYEGLYNEGEQIVDSKIGLRLIPSGNKSYSFFVSNLGREEEDVEFDLLLNYRLNQVTLFGGMIESSAGFGAIYRPSSRIDIRFQGFNFEREDLNPNLRLGFSLNLVKGFSLYAEGDDLLEQESYRAGLRLSLEDKNIKYIFGLLGLTAN